MYNFLLIEDSKEDSDLFLTTIKRLNEQAGRDIYSMTVANSYDDAVLKISDDFNGVIVDIKLDDGPIGNGAPSGNDIIKEIKKKYRLPIAIFTGTPDTPEFDSPIIVYTKGNAGHEQILENLSSVSETGLFNVLSGTGIIESAMNEVFWNNLYPQIELWKTKKKDGLDTEKILLRYAISHIQEFLDIECESYVTEEMYISPPFKKDIKTGSILKPKPKPKSKTDNSCYIILSPPCDLSIYNGKMKTDRILLCEIEEYEEVNNQITCGIANEGKKREAIEKALNNNFSAYYHGLPPNELFEGGYINFRKVLTYPRDKIFEEFDCPHLKIQDKFVKSMLNRFSAYYSRQGQPKFHFETQASNIVSKSL